MVQLRKVQCLEINPCKSPFVSFWTKPSVILPSLCLESPAWLGAAQVVRWAQCILTPSGLALEQLKLTRSSSVMISHQWYWNVKIVWNRNWTHVYIYISIHININTYLSIHMFIISPVVSSSLTLFCQLGTPWSDDGEWAWPGFQCDHYGGP